MRARNTTTAVGGWAIVPHRRRLDARRLNASLGAPTADA